MQNLKEVTVAQELNQKGIFLYKHQKHKEALEFFDKSIKEDEMYLDAYYNKALCHIKKDEIVKARQCYENILLIDKSQGEAYWHLGNMTHLLNKDYNKAIDLYNKAMYYEFDIEKIYMSKGIVLEEANKFEDALKCYNRVISKNKSNYEARIRKGQLYIKLNKINEALRTYDEAIMINPDESQAYHYKFILLKIQNKMEEAEFVIDKAFELFNEDSMIILDKISIYQYKKEYDKALEILDDLIKEHGEQIRLIITKAQILASKKDIESAILMFRKAVDLNPQLLEAHYQLGLMYMIQEDFEKSCNKFKNILDLSEENIIEDYRIISLYYYPMMLDKISKQDEAQVYYKKAINEYRIMEMYNPGNVDIVISKCLCLKETKQYEKALDGVNYLLSLNENLGEAYFVRSQIHNDLGEIQKSKEDMLKSRKLSSSIEKLMNLVNK